MYDQGGRTAISELIVAKWEKGDSSKLSEWKMSAAEVSISDMVHNISITRIKKGLPHKQSKYLLFCQFTDLCP